MKLYETFELEFAGEKLSENWASVDVTAVFTNGDTQVTTKGFYAGDDVPDAWGGPFQQSAVLPVPQVLRL